MADSRTRFLDELRLKPGVSVARGRDALTNFCLTHLGADGQYYADIIALCPDAHRLQEVLHIISAEVAKRCPDRMPLLIACVRMANATDTERPGTPPARAARPPAPSAAPNIAPNTAPSAAPSAAPSSAASAVPSPTPSAAPRGAAPATVPAQPDAAPLVLSPGVSLARAREALAVFCLHELGAGSQPLVDAINAARDLRVVQQHLDRIAAQVKQHRRDAALERLLQCVRAINATRV